MDRSDPNRFRNRKPASSTERFLGVPSNAPPLENPSSSSATDELTEDDVVFFGDDNADNNHLPSTASSSNSSTPNHHHLHHNNNHKGFGFGSSDTFGILAALPENDASPTAPNGTHFFHKASSVSLSSSSSSSSSRMIPAIPKPPSAHHDRMPQSSVMYHQSAPVNVPILSQAMMRRHRQFDDDDDDDVDDVTAEDDDVMLPPHEIVARNSAQSPMLACSVLEGVGRTLKGRDLRQVRNAVWRQTGFLD
ncbi:hypothetical protein HN51_043099 [Arachis hypogaea]|uniref:Uncharacterized protein LOC107461896 n=2 Tax=Arachis TaxID=3817 RepID=A0A6P4B9E5_ARADU|nr:uncharacterized protein LOC107461896 [Arachis duranensis]XP_052109280.1 uncharacterized protein LOC127741238 [Arachis duranensis]XP_057727991.1 protein S40-7-like [Arachis stenosperma]QHO31081.1 uncharacterized protein DS421_8g238530 [Arachis hypogaea]RYQ97798.1 hypothetical protein Ahy_B08g093875 [Arachis hypogaea]RYR43088.1 hypothetical protein Ahy_A08g039517 [Arachis hypogaea]